MVIWKYVLEITDRQTLVMPAGAELLSVANQNGRLCLWALADPSKEKVPRCIEIVGTGNPIPTNPEEIRKFVGTVIIGPFVWHVFEIC